MLFMHRLTAFFKKAVRDYCAYLLKTSLSAFAGKNLTF